MSVLPEIFDFPLSVVRLTMGASTGAAEGDDGRDDDGLGTSNFDDEDF